MPIKFACPKCKNVLTVADNLAGKTGKCKCGTQLRIPVPKGQAAGTASAQPAAQKAAPQNAYAPPAPSALGDVFDDLTDADYSRTSPHEQLYSKKKTKEDTSSLDRFDDGPAKKKGAKQGELSGTLIFIGVINILESLAAFALVVICIAASHIIDNLSEAVPQLAVGLNFAIGFFAFLGLFLLAGGIGLFMKKAWGWILVTISYAFALVDRVAGIGLVFAEEDFNVGRLIGSIGGLLVIASLTGVLYRGETQKIFGIKSNVPGIVAAVVGVVLAGSILGVLIALGLLSDA